MSKIVKIVKGDPDFMITDGIVLSPRAAISLSEDMPADFKYMVHSWYNKGWITVDSYLRDSELMWGKLSEGAEVKHETIS